MKRASVAMLCVAVALVSVSAAAQTAFATSYGAVAWGANQEGQLGNGTTKSSDVPIVVSNLGNVVAVAADADHTLALTSEGTVFAWGDNEHGQFGNGTTKSSDVPVEVPGLTGVTAIAAASHYSLALLSNGTVKAWGGNGSGQLGDGGETDSDTPVTVSELSNVTAISAGASSAMALLSNGTVKTWGDNSLGQLGDGTNTGPEECGFLRTPCAKKPVTVSELGNAVGISAGPSFDLAVLESGAARAWGFNEYGQLGDGTTTGPEACTTIIGTYSCSKVPAEISELSKVKAVAARSFGGYALLENGTVKAWGENSAGELGDGNTVSSDTPVAVSELSNVTAIAGGGSFGLALLSTGAVKSWGANGGGQLGNGATTSSDTPVSVQGASGSVAISAGESYGLAVGTPGPVVTGVSPSSGSSTGGTTVTITGSGFTEASAVTFGSLAATSFTVDSSTSITAVAPAQPPARRVDIRVTNGVGTSAVAAADQYTYVPAGNIEIGRCSKVKSPAKGSFLSKCIEHSEEGKFEWTSGFASAGFTSADATETVETVVKPQPIELETAGNAKLLCQNESGSGRYAGTREATNVVLDLTGCSLAGAKCSSAGAAEGEIVSSTLDGALGWIEREGNDVGIDLVPAGEETTVIAATCGSTSLAVRGAVIATITPVNSMSSTFTLKFKQKKGKQTPERFEGEGTTVLEVSVAGGAYEGATLEANITLTNEEALEINTVL